MPIIRTKNVSATSQGGWNSQAQFDIPKDGGINRIHHFNMLCDFDATVPTSNARIRVLLNSREIYNMPIKKIMMLNDFFKRTRAKSTDVGANKQFFVDFRDYWLVSQEGEYFSALQMMPSDTVLQVIVDWGTQPTSGSPPAQPTMKLEMYYDINPAQRLAIPYCNQATKQNTSAGQIQWIDVLPESDSAILQALHLDTGVFVDNNSGVIVQYGTDRIRDESPSQNYQALVSAGLVPQPNETQSSVANAPKNIYSLVPQLHEYAVERMPCLNSAGRLNLSLEVLDAGAGVINAYRQYIMLTDEGKSIIGG